MLLSLINTGTKNPKLKMQSKMEVASPHKLLTLLSQWLCAYVYCCEEEVRDGSGYQKGCIFGKLPKRGGGVIFNPKMLQISDL